jgi:hypothetical protein
VWFPAQHVWFCGLSLSNWEKTSKYCFINVLSYMIVNPHSLFLVVVSTDLKFVQHKCGKMWVMWEGRHNCVLLFSKNLKATKEQQALCPSEFKITDWWASPCSSVWAGKENCFVLCFNLMIVITMCYIIRQTRRIWN